MEELQDLSGEGARLVCADGHLHAEGSQFLQRRLHVGQDTRLRAADLVVPALEHALHAVGHLAIERPLQEFLDALSHEFADRRFSQLIEAVLAAGEIHRIGERRVRVDERAVEIEEHSAVAKQPGHDAVIMPRPSPATARSNHR